MPPKKKCYTKARKDGSKYTTCLDGQKKKEEEPKKRYKYKKKEKTEPKTEPTPPAPKKYKFKKKAKVETSKEKVARLKKQSEASKKKTAELKAKTEASKKRTAEIKAKKATPKAGGELAKFGLTKEQANKMDPAELFGKLQINLKKQILDPKKTGVKVAKQLSPDDLSELDGIVNELVGGEFYFTALGNISAFFANPKKYMNKEEDRTTAIGQALAKAQNKLFSGKLLKTLETMDKAKQLKGYDYLHRSFHDTSLDDALGEMGQDREDYYFADNLGVDKRDDDGSFIATSRTKRALKEYVDEYKNLKDKTVKRMKEFKL